MSETQVANIISNGVIEITNDEGKRHRLNLRESKIEYQILDGILNQIIITQI